ncbi:MAG: putative membrane protein [Paraglaciecola sp.]|jgi:putative membrane protein
MRFFAGLLTFLVAVLHLAIMVVEMLFWNHPMGQKIFDMTPEVAASSQVLAMNLGLYNGFLAVGLLWGLFQSKHGVKVFFLSCVLIAGIFGGFTAKFSIIYVQAAPALLALIFVIRGKGRQAGEQRLFS